MAKSFKFGSVVFVFVLIFLIVNLSFAWYTAKVNQLNVNELTSEGIKFSLNTDVSNTLKPDVLEEGVLTIVDGLYVLPEDYEENKGSYIALDGSDVTVYSDLEFYLDNGTVVSLSYGIKYLINGEEMVLTDSDVNNYFDISYKLYDSSSNEVSLGSLATGSYKLEVTISYKLADELLPLGLINSECITLIVKGNLS